MSKTYLTTQEMVFLFLVADRQFEYSLSEMLGPEVFQISAVFGMAA